MSVLLDEAINYLEKGFRILPLGSFNKRTPLASRINICKSPSIDSWAWLRNQELTEEFIDEFSHKHWGRNSKKNIGIITDGLVIFDADTDSAVEWCDENIRSPFRVYSGRGVHHLFRLPEFKVETSTNQGGKKIDVKANGGYVVAPPSIHGSGKQYVWEISEGYSLDDIEDIPVLDKDTWVRFTKYTSAGLKTFNVDDLEMIANETKTNEVGDRNSRLVSNCGRWYRECNYNPLMVYKKAIDFNNEKNNPPLPERQVINACAGVLRTILSKPEQLFKSESIITNDEIESSSDDVMIDKFPQSILDGCKGTMIEHVMNFLNANSYKDQPVLDLSGALSVISTITAKKIKTKHGHTYPNFYILGIADSSSGKAAPQSNVQDLFDRINCSGIYSTSEFTSSAGMASVLHEQVNNVLLSIIDEFGVTLRTVNDPRASASAKTVPLAMLKIYEGHKTRLDSPTYTDVARRFSVRNPFLNIMGYTTMETFLSAISFENVTDGLLSRLLILNTFGHDPLGSHSEKDTEPSPELIKFLKEWKDYGESQNLIDADNGGFTFEPKELDFTQSSKHLARDYEVFFHKKKKDYKEQVYKGLWGRAYHHVIKLAMIRCISRPDNKLIIIDDDIEWAKELVDHSFSFTAQMLKYNMSQSQFEKNKNEVLKVIKDRGHFGYSLRELHRSYAMTKLKKSEREEIISVLKLEGRIDNQILKPKRGPEKNVIVHFDFLKKSS